MPQQVVDAEMGLENNPVDVLSQPEHTARPIPKPLETRPFHFFKATKIKAKPPQSNRRPPSPPEVGQAHRRRRSLSPPKEAHVATVDKARIVKQDDFVTRKIFQEKDGALESLKMEAQRLLKERNGTIQVVQERDDTIHALNAAVNEYRSQLTCITEQMEQVREERDGTIHALNAAVNEYRSQLTCITEQMEQVKEVLKRQQEELQAVRRGAESGEKTTPEGQVQMSAESSTRTKPAYQSQRSEQDNMMTYRENQDMFMDSESSDERDSVTRGKTWGGGMSEEEEMIDIDVVSVHEEDEEDDEDQNVRSSSAIPAPYKFSRPRGGGGSRLRIAQGNASNRSKVVGEPRNPSYNHHIPSPASIPQTEADLRLVALVSRAVSELLDKRNPDLVHKTRPVPSTKVKEPTVRTIQPRRKQLAREVRANMNNFIGIVRDDDIVKIAGPSVDEVTLFADEDGPGPKFKPMRFYFDGSFKHPWNVDLAEQLFSHYKARAAVDDHDDEIIWEVIEQRFLNLKRKVRERMAREDEDERQVVQRVVDRRKERLDRQRPNTRRGTLFQNRAIITGENRLKSDGTVDEAWDFLYELVIMLHQEGMSSDESDNGGGQPKYYIKTRQWRSRELIQYLHRIDLDANRTNAYGKARPGNPPRQRKRQANANVSLRRAVPNLPINFYDETWYATLQNRDKIALKPKPAFQLPVIIANGEI